MFIIVKVELCDLIACQPKTKYVESQFTLILMVSARTFASAHRFVLGGKIAGDPNMITSVSYAS